ncbi:Reverse transcriptase domain-containing protein [Aphis craccivora]|uniref:Reverse transcriptase domain-containing protein n=1 Tax=Aphis craccivora TaxID=307492 RepID=A0A6G0ZM95_APHCR|nr:Reverse transcriptase domain-containing protein [Aphis craccivora]
MLLIRDIQQEQEMELIGVNTLLAYAEDIVILGISQKEIEEKVKRLFIASHNMGLVVNEAKTKYMVISKQTTPKNNIKRRTKERLYITYLRPKATYACETWASTKGDEEKLSSFERKILRKIYGPVCNVNSGIFERRKNDEIQRLFNKPSICQFVRSKIIEWAGHVWRAEGCLIWKVMVGNPTGKRPLGRPRQRWLDTVKRDLSKINNTFSIDMATDRDQWRRIVEAAKDLNGPY